MLGAWTFIGVPHFAINIVSATIAKLKFYRLKIALGWFVVNPFWITKTTRVTSVNTARDIFGVNNSLWHIAFLRTRNKRPTVCVSGVGGRTFAVKNLRPPNVRCTLC